MIDILRQIDIKSNILWSRTHLDSELILNHCRGQRQLIRRDESRLIRNQSGFGRYSISWDFSIGFNPRLFRCVWRSPEHFTTRLNWYHILQNVWGRVQCRVCDDITEQMIDFNSQLSLLNGPETRSHCRGFNFNSRDSKMTAAAILDAVNCCNFENVDLDDAIHHITSIFIHHV